MFQALSFTKALRDSFLRGAGAASLPAASFTSLPWKGHGFSLPPARTLAVFLTSGLVLAACSDHPTKTTDASADPGAQGAGLSVTPQQAHDTRPGERVFRELASEVPSFAGFYFDEAGRMVVRLVDPAQSTAMSAALVPVLERMRVEDGRSEISPMQAVYQDARYAFEQLSVWRDQVEDVLFEFEDVVMLDLDERENNLFVGLATGVGRAEAAAKVRAMGVPAEAVVFEVVGRADPMVGTVDPSDLPESIDGCYHLAFECRPLIGGYQIQFARDGGAPNFQCTIGFTALQNGSACS